MTKDTGLPRIRPLEVAVVTYDHGRGGIRRLTEEFVLAARGADVSPAVFAMISRRAAALPQWNSIVPVYVPYWPSPLFDYLSYVAPGLRLTRQLARADIRIGIAGANHTSLAFAISGRPFLCWCASPLRQEWPARIDYSNLSLAGVRNSISMGPLRHLNFAVEGWIYRRAALVLTVSEYGRSALVRGYGLDAGRVQVMYPSIDLATFSPNGASQDQVHGRYVLIVGRMDDRRKNLELAMSAFSRLDLETDVRLVVAGSLPTDGRHMRLARDLGIAERVRFLGPVKDDPTLAELYRGAVATVLTSREEGLAFTILESLACGTPVVSTRSGGPEELLQGRSFGWLASHDPDDVAHQMAQAIRAAADQQQSRVEARKFVETGFSRGALWHRFLDILQVLATDPIP